jgi:hypothetical protein
MPQPIQGPTLAEVALNRRENEKLVSAKGVLSRDGRDRLKKALKAPDTTGATQKEKARQRQIARELKKYRTGGKGAPSTRKANALFNESGRIGARARKRAAEKQAAAVKKAAKVKAAKKKAAKKAAKKAPAKKAAKRTAKKAARPVKKAAKKSR